MKDAIVIDKKLIKGGYIELRGMKLHGRLRIEHAKRKTPIIYVVENFGSGMTYHMRKDELVIDGLKKGDSINERRRKRGL